MKTITLTFALLLSGALAASAQECLNGPVTKGTVTLSCTLIDNRNYAADVDLPFFMLVVRVVTTDPDTVAVRLTASAEDLSVSLPSPPMSWSTTVSRAKSSKTQSFALSVRYDANLWRLTGLVVEELKPVASQAF